jgi:hypothetical protein
MKTVQISTAIAIAAMVSIASNSAMAETRLEAAAAAAAGRAAGRVANQMVANAIVVGAERFKGPACHRGADELRLRGIRHAIFVMECRKVL